MSAKYHRIENVAQKTGLTKRALRYYEDIKLVNPVRTDAGYRLYTDEDIAEIKKIKEFKDSLGFNLKAIKEILDLQNELKEIMNEQIIDPENISVSINEIKKQISLIEEKENALSSMKLKYEEVLDKLVSLSKNTLDNS